MELVENWKNYWDELKRRRSKGESISGVVIRKEPFGVFVDIGERFRGLVLAPYISIKKGISVSEYPNIGEHVTGVILDFSEDVDPTFCYVSISLSAISQENLQKGNI